jgi:drug/metabolite transporter (DMT)-like permease
MLTPSRKAEIYLLFMTLIWGVTFPMVKTSLDYASPFVFITIRFVLAALLVGVLFSRRISLKERGVIGAGVLIGVFLFLGYAFQTMGLKITAASKSAFITGLFVIMVPPLSYLILKEKPRIFSILGLVLAICGLYLMTRPKGSEFNTGDLLTFFCAISFSLQVIFVHIYTKKYDFATLTFVQILVTTLLSIPSIFLFDKIRLVYHPYLLFSILVCAVLATTLAIIIQNRMQKDTTAVKASLIYAMEPVFAAVFSFLLLGEVLGWLGVLGGGLILCGMLSSELGKR